MAASTEPKPSARSRGAARLCSAGAVLLSGMVSMAGLGLPSLKAAPQAAPSTTLVRDGQPRAIILYERHSPWAELAAIELRQAVLRASGVELALYPADEEPGTPETWSVVRIGGGVRALEAAGIAGEPLAEEAFRLVTAGNRLHIVGRDLGTPSARETISPRVYHSPATLWGVHYLLDHYLGVRWLWPGELGTYVPKTETVAFPAMDVRERPRPEARNLRIPFNNRMGDDDEAFLPPDAYRRLYAEALQWLEHHRVGTRARFAFGHAFTGWWERYSEVHPDYFAQPPKGFRQPWPAPGRVKLRLGNPGVRAQIIAEWKQAGAPDDWNVSPNDGSGFDTHESTLALDVPPGQDLTDIWHGRANLTVRYIRFWNALLEEMREMNPRVRLATYAYGAYRNPPPRGVKLQPGMVLGIVDSYYSQKNWKEWSETGAGLVLRPNWWHMGAVAPHLPLSQAGEFLKFAQAHGLIGFDFDSLQGNWGTQGVYYYLVARLSVRPELSVEEVIGEYCSAFGKAAPVVREYLRYWETFSEKAAYPIPAGGMVEPLRKGLYDEAVERHRLTRHPLRGSWQVLPYLYTDEVLATGYRLLEQAEKEAADDPLEVRERLRFLRHGLDHLALTRDLLHAGYGGSPAEQFARLSQELLRRRREWTPAHVVWGGTLYSVENRRQIPTLAPPDGRRESSLEGL